MRKITILAIVMLSGLVAIASNPEVKSANQSAKQPFKKSATVGRDLTRSANPGNRTTAVPFYSDDFSTGINANWANYDSAGAGRRWEWTLSGCHNAVTYAGTEIDTFSTVGTTSATGFIMFDSDSADTPGGEYGVLITDAIDCSAHPGVRLSFNELFAKFQSTAAVYPNTGRVYVSNDSTNWTLVHSADAGLSNNQATLNPTAVDVDITAVAGGQSTVYIKFSYTGDWSYWWYVDDLALTEPPAAEASLVGIDDIFNGCTLSSSETVTIEISNNGSTPISNFPASYSVNGGTPVLDTVTATINPGTIYSFSFTQTADLSVANIYEIVAGIALPGDANPSNDTDTLLTISVTPSTTPYTMGFEATDDFSAFTIRDLDGDGAVVDVSSTYTHSGSRCLRYLFPQNGIGDNWVFTNCISLDGTTTYGLSFWYKVFDVTSTTPYDGINAYLCSSNNPSDTLVALATPPTALDTIYYQVTSDFTPPATGDYFIAFRAFGNTVQNTLRLDDISLTSTPTGISEASKKAFSVYPNPSSGSIFIRSNNNGEKNATVIVTNAIGQVVFTRSYETLMNEVIDLTGQSNGVYTVRVNTANGVSTQQIVISNK